MENRPEEIKEQPKEVPKEQVILMATLKDGRIIFSRYTNFIPTLSYISKCLDYEITELMAIERTKQEVKETPTVKVENFSSLRNFLSRRHK